MINLKNMRLGAVNKSVTGDLMEVVEYENSQNIKVKFLDKYGAEVNTAWQYFESGYINNPFGKYVGGVGISGDCCIKDENKDILPEYRTWANIINRCYNNSGRDRDERYIQCYITKKWIYYKNFYEWIHTQENYENWIKLNKRSIDKDILLKNNKLYAPDRCCLVPSYVNNLFTKHNKKRGECCIGVSFHKRDCVYTATCHNPFTNKADHLGYFQTEKEAFLKYKIHKENIIKQVAEVEYEKKNISERCYKAMKGYVVEIND